MIWKLLEQIIRTQTAQINQGRQIMATLADLTAAVAAVAADATAAVDAGNKAVAAIQAGASIPDQVIADLNTVDGQIKSITTALDAVLPPAP